MHCAARRLCICREGTSLQGDHLSKMDKVLSYYDVLLRLEDVELLGEGQWLNDQVIAFFFEWLVQEAHPDLQGLLLVTGAMAFLLGHAQGVEVSSLASSLQLHSKKLVLFAVNDNPYVERAGGGSHWSLLAYSAHDRTFWHYDSAHGSNEQAARALAQRVQCALGVPGALDVEEAACPQQRNGYDCGMYVLAAAQLLCQRFQQEGKDMSFVVGDSDITAAQIGQLRTQIKQLIYDKAGQQ